MEMETRVSAPAPRPAAPERIAPLPERDGQGRGPTPDTPAEAAGGGKKPVQAMVESLNVAARTLQTNLRFMLEEGTNQLVVRVVDTQTGRVIRTIPPEDVAKAHESMQTLIGLLLDVKV